MHLPRLFQQENREVWLARIVACMPNGARVERRPLTREESEAFRSSHRGEAASAAPRCRSNESLTARSAGQLDVRQLALRWLARA